MKAVVILCMVWNIAEVLSLRIIPFQVRPVLNNSVLDMPGYRIFGGEEAKEGEFPFMIFTLTYIGNGKMSTCSSSLISLEWVLLAAHCIHHDGVKPEDVLLIGGRANLQAYMKIRRSMDFYVPIAEEYFKLQERRASKVLEHPKYNDVTLEHDIAFIKVEKPFVLQNMQTITISTNKILRMQSCTVLGWGMNEKNIQTYKLNYLRDKLVSTTDLSCLHKAIGPFLCLRPDNRGFCQGDSGSPLVCDGQVWGVASHLISDRENATCGDTMEQYYCELWYDLDWVNSVVNTSPTTTISKTPIIIAILALLFLYSK